MMAALTSKDAAALLLAAAALVPSLQPAGKLGQTQDAAATVVHIDKTPRGVTYKVDSKPMSLTPTTNLLYVLNRVYKERGPSAPLVVLIDSHLPINEIWNFDGVAGKAQLANIRYFVLIPETKTMTEIKWGPVIPISTNPPAD